MCIYKDTRESNSCGFVVYPDVVFGAVSRPNTFFIHFLGLGHHGLFVHSGLGADFLLILSEPFFAPHLSAIALTPWPIPPTTPNGEVTIPPIIAPVSSNWS